MLEIKRMHTHERSEELRIAIGCGGHTGKLGVEVVAGLDQPLARRDLGPQSSALRTVGVVIDWVWSIASVVGNRAKLGIRIRQSVRKDNGCEVDVFELWVGGDLELLVGFENDVRKIRGVSSTVALRSNMEWCLRVSWVSVQEKFEEGINIFAGNGRSRYSCAIFSIRIADVYGLVKENDICMGIPAVWVVSDVVSLVLNGAWTEFEEQTGGRTASWTAIQP